MKTSMKDQVVRVFGKADWESYYGLGKELGSQVEDILYSPCIFNKGKLVKDTCFAFIGIPAINGDPLTVAKWIEIHPEKFLFSMNPWHAGQPHTDVATLEARLYIVLREIVPGSTGKTPEELVAMLPPEYEVPTTIVEVTKNILVFRKTGKSSNVSFLAMCKESTVNISRIGAGYFSCVGLFNRDGQRVNGWDGLRSGIVGVGALRILKLKS